MKKVLSVLLAVLMMTALFAGCGSKTPATETDVPATDDTAAAADTHTVAVGAVVIARDDVPADEIYAFVSTIFENADKIGEQHAKGKELDLEFASSVTSVPYHPGAAKYFAEKGFDVASVKEGAGEGTASALTFGTGGDQSGAGIDGWAALGHPW